MSEQITYHFVAPELTELSDEVRNNIDLLLSTPSLTKASNDYQTELLRQTGLSFNRQRAKVGATFITFPEWHVDTSSKEGLLNLVATSTTPLYAACDITLSEDKTADIKTIGKKINNDIYSSYVTETFLGKMAERYGYNWLEAFVTAGVDKTFMDNISRDVEVKNLSIHELPSYTLATGRTGLFLHRARLRTETDPEYRVFGRAMTDLVR